MKTVEERFWEKVNKDGPVPAHRPELGPCWEWTAYKDRAGYGHFGDGTRIVLAHRFSFALAFGDIQTGLECCHHCDNPGCIRPDHLFSGTRQDNVDDCVAKNRLGPYLIGIRGGGGRGEANQNAKLTERDVLRIRELAQSHPKQAIANSFGVSRTCIRHIVDRNSWRHI